VLIHTRQIFISIFIGTDYSVFITDEKSLDLGPFGKMPNALTILKNNKNTPPPSPQKNKIN
jgi:hypothetical protein